MDLLGVAAEQGVGAGDLGGVGGELLAGCGGEEDFGGWCGGLEADFGELGSVALAQVFE